MQRLIDADALIEKCGEWYVEEGPEEGFIGTIKQLLESQPIVHVSDKDADTISRQAAIEDVGDGVYTGSKIRRWLKSFPSVQPERNKGEWIYGEDDGQDGWYCSECNGFVPWDYEFYGLDNIDFIRDFKTCPFCDTKMITYTGADMRGETE